MTASSGSHPSKTGCGVLCKYTTWTNQYIEKGPSQVLSKVGDIWSFVYRIDGDGDIMPWIPNGKTCCYSPVFGYKHIPNYKSTTMEIVDYPEDMKLFYRPASYRRWDKLGNQPPSAICKEWYAARAKALLNSYPGLDEIKHPKLKDPLRRTVGRRAVTITRLNTGQQSNRQTTMTTSTTSLARTMILWNMPNDVETLRVLWTQLRVKVARCSHLLLHSSPPTIYLPITGTGSPSGQRSAAASVRKLPHLVAPSKKYPTWCAPREVGWCSSMPRD